MAKDWAVRADDYDSTEDFRNAVRQSLIDAEAIQFREGGAFVISPARVEVEEKLEGVREFVTLGVRFTHTFMPAAKAEVTDDAPADDLDAVIESGVVEDEPEVVEVA